MSTDAINAARELSGRAAFDTYWDVMGIAPQSWEELSERERQAWKSVATGAMDEPECVDCGSVLTCPICDQDDPVKKCELCGQDLNCPTCDRAEKKDKVN